MPERDLYHHIATAAPIALVVVPALPVAGWARTQVPNGNVSDFTEDRVNELEARGYVCDCNRYKPRAGLSEQQVTCHSRAQRQTGQSALGCDPARLNLSAGERCSWRDQ